MSIINNMKASVFDVLFPDVKRRCPLCGADMPTEAVGCCFLCLAQGKIIQGASCAGCGSPVGFAGELCEECVNIGERRAYDECYAAFAYEEPLAGWLHRFKYEKETELVHAFGMLLESAFMARSQLHAAIEDVQMVCPVPSDPAHEVQRGFNQAALLAARIAWNFGKPYIQHALQRLPAAVAQAELGRDERKKALQGLIAPGSSSHRIAGKRILLVDDIITTGATLDAAAIVLKECGAESVTAFALAKTFKK